MCSTRGGCSRIASRSAATKPVLAPTQWMNRRSWPCTLTIKVWLVARSWIDLKSARIDPVSFEGLGGESAEDIVADAGADRRRDPQPCEVDRRVGGAAADVQNQLVDRDQLAGPGQVVQRRAKMVRHHEPGANNRGRGQGGRARHGGSPHAVNRSILGEFDDSATAWNECSVGEPP